MAATHSLRKYKKEQRRDPSKMVNRGPDRRVADERREEIRDSAWKLRKFRLWLKSIIKPRLGVDRRKGGDRRRNFTEKDFQNPQSILTEEELRLLLGGDTDMDRK